MSALPHRMNCRPSVRSTGRGTLSVALSRLTLSAGRRRVRSSQSMSQLRSTWSSVSARASNEAAIVSHDAGLTDGS